MDQSANDELPFSVEAFSPIEQHVLNERARSSVQPSAAPVAGEAEASTPPPPSSDSDDREFEEVCALVLRMCATLLERQMDQETAERGGVLVVRVVNKYWPGTHVGPELALLAWGAIWYATAPALPKPSNPTDRPNDGKAAEPS